jgi:hypothetical protein
MTNWTRVVTAGAVLTLYATPVWAHPSPTLHTHGGELIPLLTSAVVLGMALLLHRSRSRAE